MKTLKSICTLFLTFAVGFTYAQDEFLPANILMMDAKFAHHVILVEKATHKIYLYENQGSYPKLLKTYDAATGKFKGDKYVSGDHKTPEGVYTLYEFLSKEELLRRHGKYAEIYGSGAFPMDYPNFIDKLERKTGSGIWLHSTDDDNRISKGLDSRGCVVIKNADIKDISQYIQLEHTPIIVAQNVYYLPRNAWEKTRKEVSALVDRWAKAWQEKDFETYISSYDQKDFYDNRHKNYHNYRAYKKAVFSRPDTPLIKLEYISALASQDYVVVNMQQDYRSAVINDIGKKTLYLKKDKNYEWKIIGELWSKVEEDSLAFTPSKRFFKD